MKKITQSARLLISILGSIGIAAAPMNAQTVVHPEYPMFSIAQADAPQGGGGGGGADPTPGSCCGGCCDGSAGNGNGCDGCCCGSCGDGGDV